MTDQSSSEKEQRRTRTFFRKSSDAREVEGARLVNALWARMSEIGDTPAAMAEKLGISYVYLMALARGERPASGMSRQVLVASAEYIGIPTSQAFLLADILRPEDFVRDMALSEKIDATRKAMVDDPIWRGYCPTDADWERTPESAKLFACVLYERAARTQLFSETKVDFEEAERTTKAKGKATKF